MSKIDEKTILEFKKKKYLQACRIMDLHNSSVNYCNIRKTSGRYKKIVCNCVYELTEPKNELCCNGCIYLSKDTRKPGCTTQSLGCKVSFCFFGKNPEQMQLVVTEKHKIGFKRYKKLMEIFEGYFQKHDIPFHLTRISPEELFSDFQLLNIK